MRVDEFCRRVVRRSPFTVHRQTLSITGARIKPCLHYAGAEQQSGGLFEVAHTRCYVVAGFCELAVRRQPVFKALNEQEASSVSAADAEEGLAKPHHLRRLVDADAIGGEMASMSTF